MSLYHIITWHCHTLKFLQNCWCRIILYMVQILISLSTGKIGHLLYVSWPCQFPFLQIPKNSNFLSSLPSSLSLYLHLNRSLKSISIQKFPTFLSLWQSSRVFAPEAEVSHIIISRGIGRVRRIRNWGPWCAKD